MSILEKRAIDTFNQHGSVTLVRDDETFTTFTATKHRTYDVRLAFRRASDGTDPEIVGIEPIDN